jgi:hypothetical protein
VRHDFGVDHVPVAGERRMDHAGQELVAFGGVRSAQRRFPQRIMLRGGEIPVERGHRGASQVGHRKPASRDTRPVPGRGVREVAGNRGQPGQVGAFGFRSGRPQPRQPVQQRPGRRGQCKRERVLDQLGVGPRHQGRRLLLHDSPRHRVRAGEPAEGAGAPRDVPGPGLAHEAGSRAEIRQPVVVAGDASQRSRHGAFLEQQAEHLAGELGHGSHLEPEPTATSPARARRPAGGSSALSRAAAGPAWSRAARPSGRPGSAAGGGGWRRNRPGCPRGQW